ncbi:MAG: outer membrane protein assembly factor BamA [Pseudomonadota bacterium]
MLGLLRHSLLAVFYALAVAIPAGILSSPAPVYAQAIGVLRSVTVQGNQRIEADTVRTYVGLVPGTGYDQETIDAAFKRLFATGLFADVVIRVRSGDVIVTVVENPIINRVVYEGNKALDDEDLSEEVRLRPRTVYTRSRVRSDVQRIVELYRNKGRFGAIIEPKVIELPQNRVDLIFEISEGEKTGIRSVNFLGNRKFSDGDLRDEVATKEKRWWKFFGSNDTYDPDRLAYDREVLRQFYLTEGYADFRVISAVAELTPDKKDFFLTFTIEEGEIYNFGEVGVESDIRDLKPEILENLIPMETGDQYNARLIEDTIESMTNAAGLFGYAFVDIRPRIRRDKRNRLMNITFQVLEAPRVYVERINIFGNVRTKEDVIRREFRLQEGDPFNLSRVERSKQRIQSLGFFQEELEIEQLPGSAPDKVVLEVNIEERATGSLSLGAGFSSFENFLFDFRIQQRNWQGKGQNLSLGVTLSSRRTQIDIGFTEPYLFGRNLSAGFNLFRSDLNNQFESSFEQSTTGISLQASSLLSEFFSFGLRYTLRVDNVSLPDNFFNADGSLATTDFILAPLPDDQVNDEDFISVTRPLASAFVTDAIGEEVTSSIGFSLVYNSLNNAIRPSRGQRAVLSVDFAGLGGDDRYVRSRLDYDWYRGLFAGFILRIGAEGGIIQGLGRDIEVNDRFFLGGPRIRGFRIRGIGPRDIVTNDQLGGNKYYLGGAEIEFPLGEAARELGLRASAFVDVGSVWGLDNTNNLFDRTSINGQSGIFGNSPTPRISAGVGVSWNSPFGPFRIDFARAIKQQATATIFTDLGSPIVRQVDETESLQFNVGTQF